MDKKVIMSAYQIYQKKYGGSIVEISILFVNVTEALEEAAQHSVQADVACTCGSLGQRKGDDWPHAKDCPYPRR